MRRLASCICRAMARRRPITFTSSTAVRLARPAAGRVAPERASATKASRSSWVMRLAGPVPGTWVSLIPRSSARRRILGDHVPDLDVPGDDLGFGGALAHVGQLENEAPHRSGLHHPLQRRADAGLAGEVLPFEGVRIGRVPAGDALDGRLEGIEAG